MFTGIVTDIGRVVEVAAEGDTRFTLATGFDLATVPLGASIACSGVCLTVIARDPDAATFAVQASAETLSKTTLGTWQPGTPVNLERSLRLGDELGGHLVFGHVDAVAEILEIRPEGDSLRFVFAAPAAMAGYLAPKGSVALDGVSLTVNEVADEDLSGEPGRVRFGINIIAHTRQCTTFGTLQVGQQVNLEADMLARYVARQLAIPTRPATPASPLR